MREETLYEMRLHYQVRGRRLEQCAREYIAQFINHPCAIGVSWGKDSTLTAFLCSDYLNEEDWIFHVSPGRYDLPDTPSVRDRFLERFPFRYKELQSRDYFESARAYGLADITDKDTSRMRSKKTDLFIEGQVGADMRVWGLRAEESAGRRMFAKRHGKKSFIKRDAMFALSPILNWTWRDVWSVTLHYALPYLEVYDKQDKINVLARGRGGSWAGTRGAGMGRIAYLKLFYPDLFAEFVEEFPEVSTYA